MTRGLPSLRLSGAAVLRGGQIARDEIGLSDGRIADGRWPVMDLTGYLILPGIVDLYGTGFERQIGPGGRIAMPLPAALRATDREAAANGVTTAFMAQRWSWEGGVRSPDFAEALLQALAAYRGDALTDLDVALAIETHSVGSADRLLATAARHGLRLAFFTETLADAGIAARETPDAFLTSATRAGRTAAEHLAAIEVARQDHSQVPRHLCTLATGFDGMGLRYGSIGDPDAETREHMSLIGARICGLPGTIQVARAAQAVDDPILGGAAAVLPGVGPAHVPGDTFALMEAQLCDVLVSDSHYPALPAAAFYLADADIMPLPEAWSFLSERPARLAGLPDRGRIAEGLRADLVVVNAETRAVEMTVSGGRIAHLSGEAAQRLLEINLPATALAAE